MGILGITPARGGSVTVPKKNIRPILGKPLLAYTIEHALKSRMLDNYVVASDSHEILNIARDCGADVVVTPDEIADGSHLIETLLDALDVAENRWGREYQIIADIRCTNPLKTVEDIDGAINTLLETDAECVAGVSPSQHPSRIKTVEYDEGIPRLKDVWDEPISGLRQDLVPETFIRNGSIYVVKVDHLRKRKYFVGVDVVPWFMPKMRSVNIDDWMDFWAAAGVLEYFNG